MSTGIYQRPDSPYWWANWTEKSGKTFRQSTRVIVAEDPHGLRAMAVRERFMQPAGTTPDPVGNTWDELIELYLEHLAAQCRASTMHRYEAALRKLYPAFTGKPLESITRQTVKAYLRNRQVTCRSATINVEISLMQGAWEWAIDELDWELENPWDKRRLKNNPPRQRWLTREECERLLAAAEQSAAPYLHDYVRLALHTGMRPGELLGLRWDRVDLDGGRILFSAADSKNGRPASIPVNATARLALLSRQAMQRTVTPWVFTVRSGHRIASIREAFSNACRIAGLNDVHPHDLRRTFASHLVQAGVSIQTVSGLLRHSDIGITHRVYAHLSPDHYRGATAVLDTPPKLRAV